MIALTGLRVLVVDDDAAICEMLDTMLTDYGATVQTRTHAAGIVPHVLAWQPHRILLDWMMDPPGDVAIEALRQADLVPAIPLIVISAYLFNLGPLERVRSLQYLGARSYLAKPIVDWDAAVALIADPPPVWPGL